MSAYEIEKVIDGGANEGQWALELLETLPFVEIHSFEPATAAFDKLVSKASSDNWSCHKNALGSVNAKQGLHLSSNGQMSSSVRTPTGHLTAFPGVSFSEFEEVNVSRLDEFEFLRGGRKYLKLDVQGNEMDALTGAGSLLDEVLVVEVETSLTESYEGETTHYELVPWLIDKGFKPFHLFTPAVEPSGRCNYVDVLLVK